MINHIDNIGITISCVILGLNVSQSLTIGQLSLIIYEGDITNTRKI